jgi:hypothetical protein
MISAAASAIISRRAATRLRKILAARWMRPSKRELGSSGRASAGGAAPGEAQDVETARPQQYSNDGSHLRPQLFACASRDDDWAFGAKGSKGESTP